MKQPKYPRHPISARYPNITGNAWVDFVENLRARLAAGKKIGRKVILLDGQVLDGWQLYRACCELDVEPEFAQFPKNEDPVAYVETVNEHRRHEDQPAMNLRLAARRERIKKALSEGQSHRQIAAAEGISKTQVVRDIETAQVAEDFQEKEEHLVGGPPRTTHDATEGQNEPILCSRCQRVGAIKDCPKCAEQRAARPRAAAGRRRKGDSKGGSVRRRTARSPAIDTGFADASVTKAITKLRWLLAERQTAFGDHVECTHAVDHLNMLNACWERWQQDTTGQIAAGPKVFIPPTIEEVGAYCAERKNKVDPEQFVAHYSSQGWKKKNGQKVDDWKQCVITWEKNHGFQGKEQTNRIGRIDMPESSREAWKRKLAQAPSSGKAAD